MKKNYSIGFWWVNLANFFDGIVYYGILNLLTLFLSDRVGMSDAWTGRFVSLFGGLVTLFMVPGGRLCDRLGARRAIQFSLLGNGLCRGLLLLSAFVPGSGGMGLAALALLGMSMATGLIQPAVYAGARDHTRPQNMAVAFGLLYAIMNFGGVLWNLISPAIRHHYGITGTYQLLLAITWLNWLTQCLLFRPGGAINDEALTPQPTTAPQRIGASFYFLIFILVPVRTLVAHLWLTLPSVLERAYPPQVASHQEWFQGLHQLILAFGAPVLARLLMGRKLIDVMIAGTALSALSVFLLVPGPDAGLLTLYILLFSTGESIWAARFYEYVARLSPPGQFGAVMGLAHLPWFLAKFTTGLYSGALLQALVPRTGPTHPGQLWAIYGAMALITPVGLVLARNRFIAEPSRSE